MAARHHELISARHSGQFAPLPQTSLTVTDTDSLTKPASILTKHSSASQSSYQSYSNQQSVQSGSQTLQMPGRQDKWDNRVAAWGSQAAPDLGTEMGNLSQSLRHTHQE